jgi:hypothetical protein
VLYYNQKETRERLREQAGDSRKATGLLAEKPNIAAAQSQKKKKKKKKVVEKKPNL